MFWLVETALSRNDLDQFAAFDWQETQNLAWKRTTKSTDGARRVDYHDWENWPRDGGGRRAQQRPQLVSLPACCGGEGGGVCPIALLRSCPVRCCFILRPSEGRSLHHGRSSANKFRWQFRLSGRPLGDFLPYGHVRPHMDKIFACRYPVKDVICIYENLCIFTQRGAHSAANR